MMGVGLFNSELMVYLCNTKISINILLRQESRHEFSDVLWPLHHR
jgi:hypothetical protein